MLASSLFDLYRWVLTIVVGTYATMRVISFVWYLSVATGGPGRGEVLLRRYVVALLMRSRFRRFGFEFVQVGVLAVLLAYVVSLHGR